MLLLSPRVEEELLNSRLCLVLAEISALVESLWCEESAQEDVDDLVFAVPLM